MKPVAMPVFRSIYPTISRIKCRPRLSCTLRPSFPLPAVDSGAIGRQIHTAAPKMNPMQEKVGTIATHNKSADGRIYFLGVGAIGKLIAYCFKDIPEPPPMTFMFSSKARWSEFLNNDSSLQYQRSGFSDLRGGFDAQYTNITRPDLDTRDVIDNLVVATKAPFTVNALLSVKYRLRPESTIVLLQNGMGLVEELNAKVFPDIETRPHYVLGIVTHGAVNKDTFAVEHNAIGNIALTALSEALQQDESEVISPVDLLAPSTRYILRTFTRTPMLGSIALSPRDHLLVQLEKLAGNCIINPLTGILGCTNGELLRASTLKLMRLLLAEISLVICSMPELRDIPGIEHRFGPARLEYTVTKLISDTAKNQSSMLQDVMKGRKTEIDYMNGYIFRRGEELGIRSMVNFTIKTLLSTRSLMSKEGYADLVALDDNEADLETIP